MTIAINNARLIGMVLADFESEYGRCPDEATIAEVKRRSGSDWDLKGETSNDLFKQLIVAKIFQSEREFYAKGVGVKKPDEISSSEQNTLAAGECGFSYILAEAPLGAAVRPLVVASMIPGTTRFDSRPFEGKAVVLMTNGSIKSYKVEKDGRVLLGGKDLFDPTQSYWMGHTPIIKWPKLEAVGEEEGRDKKVYWVAIAGSLVAAALVIFFIRYRGPVGKEGGIE